MPQRGDQDTLEGLSRNNRRAPGASPEQVFPVEERDTGVLELLVVTAQTALGEDRRHALVEESLIGSIRAEDGNSKPDEAVRNSTHYCFMPTPNWFPARTTFPLAITISSIFSLCTCRPVSSCSAV